MKANLKSYFGSRVNFYFRIRNPPIWKIQKLNKLFDSIFLKIIKEENNFNNNIHSVKTPK